jgi:hypothetical protein
MNSELVKAKPTKRNALWYLKWLFASYAAAIAIFLLALVVSLPFLGTRVADIVFEHRSILFIIMAVVSPVVFKFLR